MSIGQNNKQRRVYLLGAGASKAFYPKLPTASELTLGHLLQPESYSETGAPLIVIRRIQEYLRSAGLTGKLEHRRFEDVLGLLPRSSEPHLPRENLEICLVHRLDYDGAQCAWSHLWTWLERVRKRQDCIITTNYDTLIEWNVADSSDAQIGLAGADFLDFGVPEESVVPYLRVERQRPLLLLKLYGSVAWSYCERCLKYQLDPIHAHEVEKVLDGRGTCSNCGERARRKAVWVPLLKEKHDSPDLALNSIWSEAARKLGEASEITFGGFSLNPEDTRLFRLLREAHETAKTERVTVVDPNASTLVSRYQSIYGHSVNPVKCSWKDYVEMSLQNAMAGQP